MIENKIENLEDELRELDDVLDHAFFNKDEDLTDIEDEFVFVHDQTEDFRSLDEL